MLNVVSPTNNNVLLTGIFPGVVVPQEFEGSPFF